MKKFAPVVILIAGILCGSMGLFVRTLNASGLASMEIVGLRAGVTAADAGSFFFCLAFCVLCTVVPYLTYTLGLQYVENGKASIIASVEPVTATLLGVLLFHEKLTITCVIGVVLVLAALAICNDKG